MPRCSTVLRLLVDYIEGRLSDVRRTSLEKHLARCPACVAYVNTYRSTVSILESLTEQDLPPELRLSLRAYLDKNSEN
jgi:anti-sigma factor RsiW